MSEPLIVRYEHDHLRGWCVSTKRRGKPFTRYFSDRLGGRRKALQLARLFRDKLVAQLPRPTKVKRRYIRNTTGIIGGAGEGTQSIRQTTLRYVASWPKRDGTREGNLISWLYGESEAFQLAVKSRRGACVSLNLRALCIKSLQFRSTNATGQLHREWLSINLKNLAGVL